MKSQRPVNLDIMTFKFTPQMVASITHRISGVIIFAGMAFVIWGLGLSLQSEESFSQLKQCLDSVIAKFIIWAILAGFIYHFVAGVRHLLMDAGYFEELESSQALSYAVMVVSAVLIIVAGIWVW
ncbi:succinate dehydrogenase, cytochrome b556 subunit [Ketobacter sp. MCCC 1A13808]|uniref:succinate dehydrogenase, cytochrome b556 subunit n=1 Tax=Ketobacter sp. MCCC 1A13808 TaxID=2602738 RepID=UPI000F1CE923|nr:succinate dehydrogenase, cytochrome b556 subunit [Ketobacter sp. MCCC 1A13808]MVF12519.1 succinate dehydrogenase, cytochrome b556 subunit [Ketobacter sp. MCCC 1A13808]RLP55677.1 MAG: succinate dehydrogenase, cytochrome b556 subunit [Ketobacter sp.]